MLCCPGFLLLTAFKKHHPVPGYVISECNAFKSLICLTSGPVPGKLMKARPSSNQTRGHCGYIYGFPEDLSPAATNLPLFGLSEIQNYLRGQQCMSYGLVKTTE